MSTTTAAKNVLPTQNAEKVVRESIGNCEKAIKSGIELQKEALNLWKDALPNVGAPEEIRAKFEAVAAEAIPAARKRMEEAIETISRTGKQTLSLAEKTADVYRATSLAEAQSRLRDLSESWFAAVRENARLAADANARIVESWTGLIGRFAPVAK